MVHAGGGRIPYVLAENVLEVETGSPPVAELAAAIARVANDGAPALAARLPVLRDAVTRRLIGMTPSPMPRSPLHRTAGTPPPLLTLAQSRMLLRLGLSRGDVLPRDPQELARAAAPVVGALALGLGGGTSCAGCPGGPLVRAAVAYAGTQALGAARLRFP